ncbi:GH18962 [Drosophila grimshawi]|uniref:GH18962 n=2 Tax=Drosophila grimshawi TaxID=7222 RepID=B4JHH5_DROGR|nr:GH18962 [Drosophila grimshawi]
MTLWLLLSSCLLAASALPIDEQGAVRINGENGWFVPQVGGELKWMSLDEVNGQLEAYETLNDLDLDQRFSINAVTFYLYTQRNPKEGQIITTNTESIDESNFNSANPTRITIHGWNSNYKDGVNTGVRDAWFLAGDYNMIAVDWQRARSLEYASSVAGAYTAGHKVAKLVDFLVKEYGMSLETLEVVGFSLGAHVAGFTAKQVTTGNVHKVVGLDPASPLFSYSKPEKRLSSTDAFYVETIQTNGGTLGFTKPIGRATFYPNGGKIQPGCSGDLTGSCSHTRAVSYYVESLRMDNFPTMKCASYQDANNKNCGSTYSSIRMGSPVNELVAVGEYYVPVNNVYPYGLGDPAESTTANPLPTTIVDTTTSDDDVVSSTTPAIVVTPTPPPEEGTGDGKKTNIYVLNLMFVYAQINK